MRRKNCLCILLFLIGIGIASLIGNGDAEIFGNEYHVQNFGVAELDKMGLLCEVLWNRGKLFLMLMVFLATPVRKWVPFCTAASISFMAGVYIKICMIQFGLKGILIFFISLLPHGIFYGMVVAVLFLVSKNRNYYRKGEMLSRILVIIIMLTLFFVGTLLEVWNSSSVLQKLFLSAF